MLLVYSQHPCYTEGAGNTGWTGPTDAVSNTFFLWFLCNVTCDLAVLKCNSPFLHIGPKRLLFLALTRRAVPLA